MRRTLCLMLVGCVVLVTSMQAQQTPTAGELIKQIQSAVDQLKAIVDPPPVTVIRVAAGGNLQAAVDSLLVSGGTVLVAPASYPTLLLKARAANAPTLTVKADTTALPAAGIRITPALASSLVKIVSSDGLYPIRTVGLANSYVLDGVAPQPVPGNLRMGLIAIGTDAATDPLQQPTNIQLLHILCVAANGVGKRCIEANSRAITVRDSYCAGFAFDEDSQCIAGWNGPGPSIVENNYLEASGENAMWGGSTDRTPAMAPRDLVFRGNYVTKPLAWRGKPGVTVKTSFELKNMQRALVEGNVFENVWGGQGQEGYCLVITPRDDQGLSPWTVVSDVEVRYNVFRHCSGGVNILGSLDDAPTSTARTARINLHDNLFYDIGSAVWAGSGRVALIGQGPKDVSWTHNTVLSNGAAVELDERASVNSLITLYGERAKAEGLVVRDSIFPEGSYGIVSDMGQGRTGLDAYGIGAIFSRNVIRRTVTSNSINYGPQTNTVVTVNPVSAVTMKPIAAYATSDGKPIGADIDGLKALMSGLDLTK